MALELRFDPEAEVGDGRDAEWVVMARACSLSEMLGLRDVDWEGGALPESWMWTEQKLS